MQEMITCGNEISGIGLVKEQGGRRATYTEVNFDNRPGDDSFTIGVGFEVLWMDCVSGCADRDDPPVLCKECTLMVKTRMIWIMVTKRPRAKIPANTACYVLKNVEKVPGSYCRSIPFAFSRVAYPTRSASAEP